MKLMNNKYFLLFFVLLITILVASACSAVHQADNFPLNVDGGSSGEVGVQRSKAGDCWSMSILFITNEGDSPIIIKYVSLTEAQNISIIETSLMKIQGYEGLLGVQEWPPETANDYPNFNTRVSAEGSVIEPGDGYNLILAVKAEADKASAAGLEIAYKDENGKQYVQKSHYAYILTNERPIGEQS